MAKIFGEAVRSIRFFNFDYVDFKGTRQLVQRGGYSKQGGFEIYLNDSRLGSALWDLVWEAGQAFNITPGCPNLIERIEGGLLSYGNEFTLENNPLECGMGKLCTLDGTVDFLGLKALQRIAEQGHQREIRGVMFDGGPGPACGKPWPVMAGDQQVGQITSAMWSPRLKRNVGLSMIARSHWAPGQAVSVHCADGVIRPGEVCALPFA
jgi:dimethylsulfoniopropionate demethylase